ncbi:MAG: sugar ABC transporter ATP-binding protein [Bifidobacterium psychraerophilum]|uniref:sugar ABC transporter ATP-binding protein n=1 Tax=Bifidobacterium psychraerophilum TaxID=218140 RepID=UPI0039E861D5
MSDALHGGTGVGSVRKVEIPAPDGTSGTGHEVLRVEGIVKHFGATKALRGVDFTLNSGEILALVGANGAGKSTLTSILSGIVEASEGRLVVEGREVRLTSILDASQAGIETIVQSFDEALFPGQTVGDNLAFPMLVQHKLGAFPGPQAIRRAAAEVAKGVIDIPLNTAMRELDASERQRVLIARALFTRPKILILDEPTASLDIGESRRLHERIRALADSGTAIIYISHHMKEVADICDRAVVLRDGAKVGEYRAPLDIAQIIRAMLGKSVEVTQDGTHGPAAQDGGRAQGQAEADGDIVLKLRDFRIFTDGESVNLDLREGETLGITGLIGAGKTELLSQIVGASPLIGGTITWRNESFNPRDTGEAIAAGIGYVPENRQSDAEIPLWSVEDNLVFPDLKRYRSRSGFINPSAIRRSSEAIIARMGIVGSSDARIESLSGGNRQKVMIGRWFAAGSKLLVMDEPFRGVDIGARSDIATQLRAAGTAIVASSDPDEILQVADRIIVLSHGAIVAETSAVGMTSGELSELIATGA